MVSRLFLFTSVLFCSVLLSVSAVAQQRVTDMVEFNADEHDFGKIKQGTPVYYSFEMKNKLNKPVIIENVQTSCGCTTPEWSKEPLATSKKSTIKVGYNAATVGNFNKSIQVILQGSNVPYVLRIKGEVVAK